MSKAAEAPDATRILGSIDLARSYGATMWAFARLEYTCARQGYLGAWEKMLLCPLLTSKNLSLLRQPAHATPSLFSTPKEAQKEWIELPDEGLNLDHPRRRSYERRADL